MWLSIRAFASAAASSGVLAHNGNTRPLPLNSRAKCTHDWYLKIPDSYWTTVTVTSYVRCRPCWRVYFSLNVFGRSTGPPLAIRSALEVPMQPSTIACRAGSHYSGYRSLGFSLSIGDFSSGNASGFGRRLRAARSTEDAAD